MNNRYCVIMAGGIGSRFWPMSRDKFPKQFIDILGSGKSLLRQTYERFLAVCPKENIYVVTNESYVDLVKLQLPELTDHQVLGEPMRRNTAPCIAYAAYKIAQINPDANMVVAPSDHVITNDKAFHEAIACAFEFTEKQDSLVTLGIHPSRPDTGYGYIQFKEDGSKENKLRVLKVKTFTEKPNLEMAKFFLKSGDFVWNSGIFIWNAKTIIQAMEDHLPEINNIFKEGISVYNSDKEKAFIKTAYAQCTNISIDYGIMEKSKKVYVLATEFGWSDLGTWRSLYDQLPHDQQSNAIVGQHVMLEQTANCIISVRGDKLAVIQGLNDFIIVETDNVLLICPKQDEQQIRQLVNDVKIKKGEKYI